MVAILDYGVGNLMAIQNIVRKAGGESIVTMDAAVIDQAQLLILPGVGSFDYCMAQLRHKQLVPILQEQVLVKKKKILGLCVGAQMMTASSEEGSAEGLAWVNGKTVKFDTERVPITPHMGWTDVKFKDSDDLGHGFVEDCRFYFVHSYHFMMHNQDQVLAKARYGYEFACAFRHDNIYGVQFHPEKSHKFGVRLFENFLTL